MFFQHILLFQYYIPSANLSLLMKRSVILFRLMHFTCNQFNFAIKFLCVYQSLTSFFRKCLNYRYRTFTLENINVEIHVNLRLSFCVGLMLYLFCYQINTQLLHLATVLVVCTLTKRIWMLSNLKLENNLYVRWVKISTTDVNSLKI